MKILSISGHVIRGEPAGYCTHEIHKGYLSDRLMNKHKCRKKKCKYFIGIKYKGYHEATRRKQRGNK